MSGPEDLHDRYVGLGLPSTDELLNELDLVDRRIHGKVFTNLVTALLCDLPALGILGFLAWFWAVTTFVTPLAFVGAPIAGALGLISLKVKASLYSAVQDRASIRRRVDARLAEPTEITE